MNRLCAALALFLLSLLVSHPLLACAVCGPGEQDPTLNAYQGSTAMLSLIPLAAIGGVVFIIYKYVKREDN